MTATGGFEELVVSEGLAVELTMFDSRRVCYRNDRCRRVFRRTGKEGGGRVGLNLIDVAEASPVRGAGRDGSGSRRSSRMALTLGNVDRETTSLVLQVV